MWTIWKHSRLDEHIPEYSKKSKTFHGILGSSRINENRGITEVKKSPANGLDMKQNST